jgi:hypothetical protein
MKHSRETNTLRRKRWKNKSKVNKKRWKKKSKVKIVSGCPGYEGKSVIPSFN